MVSRYLQLLEKNVPNFRGTMYWRSVCSSEVRVQILTINPWPMFLSSETYAKLTWTLIYPPSFWISSIWVNGNNLTESTVTFLWRVLFGYPKIVEEIAWIQVVIYVICSNTDRKGNSRFKKVIGHWSIFYKRGLQIASGFEIFHFSRFPNSSNFCDPKEDSTCHDWHWVAATVAAVRKFVAGGLTS